MTETTATPTPAIGNGLRLVALLNLLITLIAAPAIWLLGIMIASGNPAHETSFNIASLGGLYAFVAVIVGLRRAWKDNGSRGITLFLLMGWLLAVAAFALSVMIIDALAVPA